MSVAQSFFIQICYQKVVVAVLFFAGSEHLFIEYGLELFIPGVDCTRRQLSDVRLIQEHPLSMPAFKDLEMTIEKRFESFKVPLRGDLLFTVEGCIHQMIYDLL